MNHFPLLQQAIQFATEQHAGQYRDGDYPLPYITHPIDVLCKLRHVGGVTEEAPLAAAILHDVIEESDVTRDLIESLFGSEIATLVLGLTRREPTEPEKAGLTRDQVYELRSSWLLEEISHMSPECQTVKLADRLSNLEESIRTRKGKKHDRYLKQTRAILQIIPKERNPGLWTAIEALLCDQL